MRRKRRWPGICRATDAATAAHTPALRASHRAEARARTDPSCRTGRSARAHQWSVDIECRVFGPSSFFESLQPAYRVVPDVNAPGTDAKSLGGNGFSYDLGGAIKRSAAGVVSVYPRALDDDP